MKRKTCDTDDTKTATTKRTRPDDKEIKCDFAMAEVSANGTINFPKSKCKLVRGDPVTHHIQLTFADGKSEIFLTRRGYFTSCALRKHVFRHDVYDSLSDFESESDVDNVKKEASSLLLPC